MLRGGSFIKHTATRTPSQRSVRTKTSAPSCILQGLALSHHHRYSVVPLTQALRTMTSTSKDAHREAIGRAEELHAELKEMIDAQKAAKQTPLQQSNKSSFGAFLKSSKPQIFNIFFAFVCVILAHQVHALRQGYKKLLGEMEVKEGEIDQLRKKLREICDVDESDMYERRKDNEEYEARTFVMSVSEKCTQAVGDIFAQSDRRPGYTWILARKLASGDAMESSRVTDAIRQIMTHEMRNIVGDIVWSEDELKQKKAAELNTVFNERANNANTVDASMGGLVEMLQQVHQDDLANDTKKGMETIEDSKVKRTRYAI